MDQGTSLENEDKQSCLSCMRHSMLICSLILPSIIIIFLKVAKLCSENKVKIWIRGHNSKMKIGRVVILVRDPPR